MTATTTLVKHPSNVGPSFASLVRKELERAGVEVGGGALWDITVNDESFYRRLAMNPAYELGATYVDGLWDCPAIDQLMTRLFDSGVAGRFERGVRHWGRSLLAKAHNLQSRLRASMVADQHYDLGNELFETMLDSSMMYTCAIFPHPQATLAEAQTNKLASICDKLELRKGDRFLDVGCGWGGLVEYAARRHGATGTGITISKNQLVAAQARASDLPGTAFKLLDYRDLPKSGQRFDKVASIEMIEAVGPKNFETFFESVHAVMAPRGRFVLQCFISNQSVQVCNEWFDRHIFPNGVSPSLAQLSSASERLFGAPAIIEDIGRHYDPTLMAWDANFNAGFERLSKLGYDQRFRRMWHFYLRSLAGSFRTGHLRCYHIVYERGAR